MARLHTRLATDVTRVVQAHVYISFLEDKLADARRDAETKAGTKDRHFGDSDFYANRVIAIEELLVSSKSDVRALMQLASQEAGRLDETKAGLNTVLGSSAH